MSQKNKGFTLIELMVVVAIIGILAVFVVPRFVGQGEKAKVDATVGLIAQLKGVIDMFKLQNGRYPAKLEDLVERPSYVDEAKWPDEGYMDSVDALKDAWGNDFRYSERGPGGTGYEIMSFGADGQEGGDGVNEDIYSHKRRAK